MIVRAGKIVVLVIFGSIILGCQHRVHPSFSRNQAAADLTYVVEQIAKYHVAAVTRLPAAVQQQYQKELQNLKPTQSLLELWQAAARITAMLADGHTQVWYPKNDNSQFQVDYLIEQERIKIQLHNKKYLVARINGIAASSVYQMIKALSSYENSYGLNLALVTYLKSPAYYNNKQQIEYLVDGKPKLLTPALVKVNHAAVKPPFIRYELDPQAHFAVLTIDACKYNDTYRRVVAEFFTQVKLHKIPAIAIDLRNNSGGTSDIIVELIKYLPTPTYRDYAAIVRQNHRMHYYHSHQIANKQYNLTYFGKIYVLTAPKTFSAATMLAVVLQDNHLAQIIGEPSSNKPTAYGDIAGYFVLPNSKLTLITTSKKFIRPDLSKATDVYQIPDFWVKSSQALEYFKWLCNKHC